MKVKGLNDAYYVDIERTKIESKNVVQVTVGNFIGQQISVVISCYDWIKIAKTIGLETPLNTDIT